jgi:hypothetical protein
MVQWEDDFNSPNQKSKTTLYAWQPSFIPKPETIADRMTDWDNAGSDSAKWFQGFVLDADTFNVVKTLYVRDADSDTTHAFTPNVQHDGQEQVAYSFNTPFIAHTVRIEPPVSDTTPWRFFGVKWVAEPTPEQAETWQTQFTTHGLMGYMHIRQISLCYQSTTSVTLTITAYDGTSPQSITLPSTGGAVQKITVPVTFNKGQIFSYRASSSAPFQVFVSQSEVLVGQWQRNEGYVNRPLVGDIGGDTARI